MKRIVLLILFLALSAISQAQLKFGARSGAGVYFNTLYLNLLASSYPYISGKSVYGNPLPRDKDEKNHHVYTDAGFSQEIFAKWRVKNELSFSFTYIKEPRAYNDDAELYWGQNEDHREIYYQLIYSRTYWESKKLSFQAGLGIAINKFYVSRAVYTVSVDANGNILLGNFDYYTSGKDPKQFDWGFPLKLQLNYNINKNAALGLQSNIIYLFQLGINHITLTPTLQISF